MPEVKLYPNYIHSGYEWLGNIPADWPLLLISQVVEQVKKKNSALIEQNLLSLSYGKIKRKPIDTNGGLLPASFDGYNIIEANDIVLRLTDLQNDHTSLRVGLSNEHGIITSAYVTLRPRDQDSAKYLYYILHTFDIRKGFYGMGSGVRQGLNYDEVRRLRIPYPSIIEQKVISNYLDNEISHTDELINEAKMSIEDYKKWKAAIIYETVTKGLNPNAEMIDSGITWIGIVPKGWHVCKTLYALSMPITDGPHTTPEFFNEGIPFVSAEAVSCGNGKIDFDHIRGFISEEFYQECCLKYIPQINDILMIKSGATTGKVSYVDTDNKFTIWSPLAVFRVNEKRMYFKYLFYFLQSEAYQKQVQLGWTYGTQQNIGMRTLETLKICMPSLDEQHQISTFLDEKCGIIDSLVSEKNKLITDLESYKKSLIFEVVTGKRKVV